MPPAVLSPRCWRRSSGPSSGCRPCDSRGCTWPSRPSPPRRSSPTGSGAGSGCRGHGTIVTSYPTDSAGTVSEQVRVVLAAAGHHRARRLGGDQPVPDRPRPVVHRHPRPGHRRRGDGRARWAGTRSWPSPSPAAWPASPERSRPSTPTPDRDLGELRDRQVVHLRGDDHRRRARQRLGGGVRGHVHDLGSGLHHPDRAGAADRARSTSSSSKLAAVQLTLFGLVLVVFLLLEPRGLARLWQRAKDYFRIWPFRY